jgi:hypothetical protein
LIEPGVWPELKRTLRNGKIEIQNELMGKMGINNVSIPLIACSMTDEKLTELAKELREMVGMLKN